MNSERKIFGVFPCAVKDFNSNKDRVAIRLGDKERKFILVRDEQRGTKNFSVEVKGQSVRTSKWMEIQEGDRDLMSVPASRDVPCYETNL